jgi:hypothetical protein
MDPTSTRWKDEHEAALKNPRGWEEPFVLFLRGLRRHNPALILVACAAYRRIYQRRFEYGVDEDYILGDEGILVLEQHTEDRDACIRAVRRLLDGEHGRLDAGTLDAELVAMLGG